MCFSHYLYLVEKLIPSSTKLLHSTNLFEHQHGHFQVVFLNRGEPDLEFEGLLKREKTRVTYFQGTMLKYVGLDAEDGVDVEVVVEVDVYVVIVIVVVISSIAVC